MSPANVRAIDAAANTGTVTSAAFPAQFLIGATAQAFFTDNAAAGSLKLQGSNDPPIGTPTHWSDIQNSSAAVTAGATTCTPPLAAYLCYQWIRVAFVSSGGAGTLSAHLHTWSAA